MVRMAMATVLVLMCSAVRAEAASVYGMIGGWAYDISGVYTNTSELDLEDDLAQRESSPSKSTPASAGQPEGAPADESNSA